MSATSATRGDGRAKLPLRSVVFRVLVGGVGLVIAGIIIVLYLLRTEPRHWTEHRAFVQNTPPQQRAELAEHVQQHVSNTLSNLSEMPDGKVHVRLPIAEANAWLELKLPGWLTFHNLKWPPEIRSPMVATTGSDLVIAFELGNDSSSQIVSMAFDPQVPSPGVLSLQLRSIKGGRLSLPLSLVTSKLREAGGNRSELDRLAAVLEGQPLDARGELERGRRWTLEGLTIGADEVDVVLTLETTGR